MDDHDWITRCSAHLHAQWPRIGREQRDEVAAELACDARWRTMEPEDVARNWLLQGIPTAA